MRVEYDQTEDDLIAAGAAQLRYDPVVRKQLAARRKLATLFVLGGAVFLALYVYHDAATPTEVIVGCGMGFFGFAVWPTRARAMAEAKRFARRVLAAPTGRCLLGPRSVEVRPDALAVKSRYSETTLRWEAVGAVLRDDEYVYISIPGPAMYAIPRTAFPSDTKFEQFAAAAEAAHRAAHPEGVEGWVQ